MQYRPVCAHLVVCCIALLLSYLQLATSVSTIHSYLVECLSICIPCTYNPFPARWSSYSGESSADVLGELHPVFFI